jgi:ATP-dependent DNA helicase RecG
MPPTRVPRIPRAEPPGPAPPREPPAIRFLKGIGPKTAEGLRLAGIETPADLLVHYPRAHEDRREVRPVASIRDGDEALVRVRILENSLLKIPRGLFRGGKAGRPRSVVRIRCADDSGVVDLEMWNQPWRRKEFTVGAEILAWGKASRRGRLVFTRPEAALVRDAEGAEKSPDPLSWGRIVPVYPRVAEMSQPKLRAAVREALGKHAGALADPIPPEEARGLDLPTLREAVERIHFPATPEDLAFARRRLEFEELLLFQTALALRRRSLVREARGFAYALGPELDRRIRARFPFSLTPDQDRAVADILADLRAPHPMNRLLQGDVGSGKTAVALYAMLAAVANRRQAAILAPTEILAEQHHRNFGRALEGSRVRIALLAGRAPAKERRALVRGVADGTIRILVATHAVLESDVAFRDLGVAVVDEQHRFGVRQRSVFREKGMRPDLLYLTATPIPRTLALSLYGDLDVSVLAERPPGRLPVRTVAVGPGDEHAAHEVVRRECAAGRQAFFVCPLVEETKKQDLKAAKQEAERLRDEVFPGLPVGLLHGRMKGPEKRAVMEAFRAGRIRVLVSTVVIEVGVDVPNASVLAVLHAERFGLTQLHQLRGRIGRGPHPATCFLFASPRGGDARGRIEAMLDTDDGFKIAEWDLRLRGFGEIFGTRQSGIPDLRFPEALLNGPLLDRARRAATGIVERDPDLAGPTHRTLREAVVRRFGAHLDLVRV